ncbi:hypothetical protein N2152v2_000632 [Parachlorella kessleri]
MASDGGLTLAPGNPRTLAFTDSVRKDLKLLELDEDLLQELLQSGLQINGGESEEAVLCSQTRTFAIKTVETTNSVWLVQPDQVAAEVVGAAELSQPAADPPQCTPPGQLTGLATQLQRNKAAQAHAPVMVTAVASSHWELVRAGPRLQALDALLQEQPYGREAAEGDEAMDLDDGARQPCQRYTREELLERVQASSEELDQALRERHALCLDGRYCSVDSEYLGTLLEMLLLTAVQHGWAGDFVIPARAAGEALKSSGYDPRLTQHCLKVFGSRQGDAAAGIAKEADYEGVWRLDEQAVCRHFAQRLLASQPQWGAEEFLDAWQGSVPESMTPGWEMLRGEALVAGGRVKRFPVEGLPKDPAGRFAALFAERERWAWEDLEPYIIGLQGPGQTVEGLLLKYARASQPKPTDPMLYSAR